MEENSTADAMEAELIKAKAFLTQKANEDEPSL